MKKRNTIFLCLAAMAAMLNAQEKNIKKAETNFNNYAYAEAISSYEHLVKKGYSDEQIFKNLGNAHYLNANYQEAASWYEKLFKIEEVSVEAEYMYRYAQSLKSLQKYKESDMWMQKVHAAKSGDNRAQKFIDNEDYLDQIKANSGRYSIKNMAINSEVSDFAPSFYGESLVFSTARDSGLITKRIHKWNNNAFLNLYLSAPNENDEYVNTDKLSKLVNKKTHESSTAFTKDGSTIYFTRNNSENGNFSRDDEGVSRLKIFKATKVNDKWTNIIELPFNGDNYSVAHPALSPDESKLFFASDMEGTYGASDIFVVDINKDGSYGTPKNVGAPINTESRETFPYVTSNNILYFSSDGHPGLGGLDVFATDLNNTQKTDIKNIGKPVNSVEDDFSFIFNEESRKGYFASNREGGNGDDDIYSFNELKPLDLECHTIVNGKIKDHKTGAAIAGASVIIYDSENNTVSQAYTKNDGSFTMDSNCEDGNYKLVATKESYNDGDKLFTTVSANDTTDVELTLEKTRLAAAVGTELGKLLGIEPIYFDFDKSHIRRDARVSITKIIDYMNKFPEIKVEIGSHTDSRANDQYNQGLSLRRAKATSKYMVEQGISEERLTFKGFGETQLSNECTNGVPCTKEKHQRNRRSEFIIIE